MNRDAPELAVLIDSDNAQAAVFSELLAAVAQLGTATVKGPAATGAPRSAAAGGKC